MLPGSEAQIARVGDHRSVVSAELGARVIDLSAVCASHLSHTLPQQSVGTDPAGDDQALVTALGKRAPTLDDQRVDGSLLKGVGDVSAFE